MSDVFGGKMTINLLGDANGNGKVDYMDIDAVINYILHGETENFFFHRADVNKDDVVNATDIVLIVNMIK